MNKMWLIILLYGIRALSPTRKLLILSTWEPSPVTPKFHFRLLRSPPCLPKAPFLQLFRDHHHSKIH